MRPKYIIKILDRRVIKIIKLKNLIILITHNRIVLKADYLVIVYSGGNYTCCDGLRRGVAPLYGRHAAWVCLEQQPEEVGEFPVATLGPPRPRTMTARTVRGAYLIDHNILNDYFWRENFFMRSNTICIVKNT